MKNFCLDLKEHATKYLTMKKKKKKKMISSTNEEKNTY